VEIRGSLPDYNHQPTKLSLRFAERDDMNYTYPNGAPGESKGVCTIGVSQRSHTPGVVYLHPGTPAAPLFQQVFVPNYSESDERALL